MIVIPIVVGVVLYRWQEARQKERERKEKGEEAERERKEKEEQAEGERREKEEQAESERKQKEEQAIVPVSKEQCLLTAHTLMNPLGLENDAVLH